MIDSRIPSMNSLGEKSMPESSLAYLSAHQLSQALAARRLSPVELIDAFLARIQAHEPKLQAFIEVYADDARLAAHGAEAAIRSGHAVGPLHGDADRAEGPDRDRRPDRHRRLRSLAPPQGHAARRPWSSAGGAGHDRAGQDPHGRVRDGRLGHQLAARHALEPLGSGTCSARPAARAAAPASPSPPGWRRGPSAPTPAARCGCRRRGAASPA